MSEIPGPAPEPADPLVGEPPPPGSEPAVAEQVEETFGALETDAPLVGIVHAGDDDRDLMAPAEAELDQRDIRFELRAMDARRQSDMVADYSRNARMRGLKVIIAAAGDVGELPSQVAAAGDLPVIAVPQAGGHDLEALLARAAAEDAPFACVGVERAREAAVFAARVLGP